MRILYFSFSIILIFSACKKSEIEQVPYNEAPKDTTISTITIENYITRTYILTLGREPDSMEFNTAKSLFSTTMLDSTSRQIFLDSVFKLSYCVLPLLPVNFVLQVKYDSFSCRFIFIVFF